MLFLALHPQNAFVIIFYLIADNAYSRFVSGFIGVMRLSFLLMSFFLALSESISHYTYRRRNIIWLIYDLLGLFINKHVTVLIAMS